MHKRVLLFIALLVAVSSIGFTEPYDGEFVREVMQNNLAEIQALGSLIEDKEYFEIAASFFSIAEGMVEIIQMDPPRGAEEDWQDTIDEVIRVAFLGVGACAVEYDAGILDAFASLRELSQVGHMAHRPRS